MRKAARPSGGVDSLNPCRWRGKWLHHHGGGVCCVFVLFWMNSWCHKLIVCKIWYKNNLKMRLTALLFDPPTRAPYHLFYCCENFSQLWNEIAVVHFILLFLCRISQLWNEIAVVQLFCSCEIKLQLYNFPAVVENLCWIISTFPHHSNSTL